MLISRNWLQKYFIEELPSALELANLFAMHAFEVEGIEEKDGDDVIEVDILPNRAHDAMSHWGVAREVAALLDRAVEISEPEAATDKSVNTAEHLTLTVEDSAMVSRATKRLVTDVVVGPSPQWLVDQLAVLGQRSINNIVDITNYVMLEIGQPVHAFDFDKLTGDKKEITIRGAKQGEQVTTLDGDTYELTEGMLVIADSEKALDVAGIKGGNNSGIDENTTRIVISICNFDQVQIRRTSHKLKLFTDASRRFGHGLTPELPAIAQERTAQLVAELASGKVGDVVDVYPAPIVHAQVTVSQFDINDLLGSDISTDDIKDIFRRLRFEYTESNGEFDVTIPHERLDLRLKQDLVEEIGRVYGYNNIQSQLLTKTSEPEMNKEFYYAEKIRDVLVGEGFSEISTYTLVDTGDIELANAFANDKGFLRSALQDNMMKAFKEGMYYKDLVGMPVVKVFDIGTVFSADDEHTSCAIGAAGMKPGKIEKLLQEVVVALSESLGTQIDAKVVDGVVEFNLTKLSESLPDPENYDDIKSIDTSGKAYNAISSYPFVTRDIAIWTPVGTTADAIQEMITKDATDLLARIDQFDEFSKDDRTSFAFKLVFQSHERTLTDDEVGKIMETITNTLNAQDGFEVR